MKVLAVLLLLSGFAFASEKPTSAQVTIKSDPATIKAALMRAMVSEGFVVDSDTPLQLQVSKPLRTFGEAPPSGKEVLFGGSASPLGRGNHDCREVHPVILVPSGESTEVTMRYEQMCGHVGGDIVREVRVNKHLIKQMQERLDTAKAQIEKPSSALGNSQ